MSLIEEALRRGIRGLTISNGETLTETDVDIIVHNVMKMIPSADVRLDYLKSTMFDLIPDKEDVVLLTFIKILKSAQLQVEFNVHTKEAWAFNESLHHIFLLSGYLLRTRGSSIDDLLHNMISYYEAYKILAPLLPQEIQANIGGIEPLSTKINELEVIRTQIDEIKGYRWLIETQEQEQLITKIRNNGL